jgi:histidine ammonia-lyase
MTVVITGRDLSVDEVVRVARHDERVHLDAAAVERMTRSRSVVEKAVADGEPAYGLTTGVGASLESVIATDEMARFNSRVVERTQILVGESAGPDVVRATMLCQLNGFASATVGVRPLLAERFVRALNGGDRPSVGIGGSVGQGDLAPLADVARHVTRDLPLAAGEGLALVNGNAFSTGWAALAITDATRLLEAMESAGALSLEAIGNDLTMLDSFTCAVRPYPGLAKSTRRLRDLLDGSALWDPQNGRGVQALTFLCLPQVHGACWDAVGFVHGQLSVELNASQGCPIVDGERGRILLAPNFEILPLATALDTLRLALAPTLTCSQERAVKLLASTWSGLPTGLLADGQETDNGLEMLGIAAQALAAEARLLAAPVSFEVPSSSHAQGLEDRTTMAPLACRRLSEMVRLGSGIVAIEAVIAAQAIELSERTPIGDGCAKLLRTLRQRVPFHTPDSPGLPDLDAAITLIWDGSLCDA